MHSIPKKKIENENPENELLLQERIKYLKEDILGKYDNSNYEKEINLMKAMIPFVNPNSQKLLDSLCEVYYYKGVFEKINESV